MESTTTEEKSQILVEVSWKLCICDFEACIPQPTGNRNKRNSNNTILLILQLLNLKTIITGSEQAFLFICRVGI